MDDHQLIGQDLCSYVSEYSERFVKGHENVTMLFEVEVEKLWREEELHGAWKLRTKHLGDHSKADQDGHILPFDKVVLCTGVGVFEFLCTPSF